MPTIKIVPFPGVPGPQGPRGLQGIQGEQGLTGPMGPRGEQGLTGPAGSNGTNGTNGAPGADGADALWSFEGEWVNGVDYAPGSVVQFEGSSYYHPQGQFSSYAPPGYGWLLVSAKGDPGENGTNGAAGVAGIPAFLPLTAFQEASNYAVGYGQFSHATYGNSIAIAKTPQVDAYMNYAISSGVPQSWTFKSFGSHATFSLTLGVPASNVENVAPNKDIWVLEYNGYDYGDIAYALANGNEYGLFLTKTGALSV